MSRYPPTRIGTGTHSDPAAEVVMDRDTAVTDQLPPGCAPVARSLPLPARREPSRWARVDGAGCQRAAGSTCPCTPGHRRTWSRRQTTRDRHGDEPVRGALRSREATDVSGPRARHAPTLPPPHPPHRNGTITSHASGVGFLQQL